MIYIIVPKGLSSGVINSQILKLATYIKDYQKVTVLMAKSDINSSIDQAGLSVQNFDAKFVSRFKDTDTIYIRDVFTFLKVYGLRILFRKKFKVFYDFRGIVFEESWYKHKSIYRKSFLFYLEKFAYSKADQVGAVSNKLKSFLATSFNLEREVYVTPCCISDVFKKIVKTNLANESIKFVYVGGISKWQRISDVLLLYKKLSKEMDCSLTIITKGIDEAKVLVDSLEVQNVYFKSLSQKEVIDELKVYDFGFLLRDDTPMNNVASPIKFLEYTSNGVIPIMTNGIGDYSLEVMNGNLGIIIDDSNKLEKDTIEEKFNDANIHERLFNYSSGYLWEKFIEKHPLTKN